MDCFGVEAGSNAAGCDDAVKRSGTTAEKGFADALSEAVKDGRETSSVEGGGEYPLEAYSLPDWYVGLTGGYTTITVEIGASYEDTRTEFDKLNGSDQRLYSEYSEILDEAFHDALDLVGVSGNTGKYYNDFIKNHDNQRLAYEAVCDSLESNPRAVKLMQYFGITTG